MLLSAVDDPQLWQLTGVAALSALKYMVGVVAAIALRLPFWQQWLLTAGGGLVGVVVYTLLGAWIRAWIRRWLQRRASPAPEPKSPRPWVLWVWKHLGMPGLALITPPLLGPPMGIPLALALGASRRSIILWVGLSVLLWSGLFAGFSGSVWLASLLP